ncbi:Uncharacterized protein PECH_001878 [Penicillium ucsense]|uniref:RING-type E3 ubiquitin transferase n=1 Tax=Penicillium ucsense TaxID=2839758 RepID=A0A8J8VWW4_9EURO|nr:Uncharacterized protein PECM_001625 [Penicillium ucsense]KAF7732210.1 Uncharacterized protein PECH_001878 [Penicillium ucsense]
MDFTTQSPYGPAATSSFPDLMNDKAYDKREAGPEDADTCRICHGEGTEEEPLFYPCRCSGSIKFVHQTCLVEWLSHSQKKHCELCKTHFRFTKLYDPNMPKSLPTPLFIQQAFFQVVRTLITWLRFLLVAFVWLGWLPWSMRAIWRALFWLADGRWSAAGPSRQTGSGSASGSVKQWAANHTGSEAASLTSMGLALSSSSPASSASTSAVAALPAQSSAGAPPTGEPLMLTLIKKIIPSLFVPAWSSSSDGSVSETNGGLGPSKARYPSWLSDVNFLKALTPYPTINNMIIDTLEGQLITLLVVVAFILLFLIREWVVQQQPMANIAEGEREAALQLIANDRVNDGPELPQMEHEVRDGGEVDEPDFPVPEGANDASPGGSRQPSPVPSWTDSDDGLPAYERMASMDDEDFTRIPSQNDDFMGNRQPAQDSTHAPPTSDISLLQDILMRANGDRDEILRIIRREGHEDELAWIVQAITRSQNERPFGEPFHEDGIDAAPIESSSRNAEMSAALTEDEIQHRGEVNARMTDDERPDVAELEAGPPKVFIERAIDWFWGDVTAENLDHDTNAVPDEEHIVQDPALEGPFVPVPNRLDVRPADEVAPAGPGPDGPLEGNDADAIEGDDFDGILDLIGMQGPIFGLLQNGVFCALLIAFTIAIGIWLPYLWGKIALVLLANPLQLIIGVPMTAVTVIADIVLDTLIGSLGYSMYWMSLVLKILASPFGNFGPTFEWLSKSRSITSTSISLIDKSTERLNKVVRTFLIFQDSDIPMFSVLSHQALKLHQARLVALSRLIFTICKFALYDFPLRLMTIGIPAASTIDLKLAHLTNATTFVKSYFGNMTMSSIFTNPGSNLLGASAGQGTPAAIYLREDLAVWDTTDRAIAIAMGYLLATMAGFLYLRVSGLLAGANRGQRVDGVVAEVLLQAGGVMKVILIIGIEMIVFPLYCGTLLDVALLPLFSEATISSRIAFTMASPLTSLFVHWFIGTCYMFHFALFVSMCRKILRSGVLYFIRDPDDPTFHPIRDVLERSITTQLRKIAFSALVYGALVIVCLGGVVWGLFYALDGVLPIHWSSSAPMLEFPVDLLFYNFVLPLALQSVKPSDILHELYDWWFHKCAHLLRLSSFFFPERHPEEEGHHVRRTWWSFFSAQQGDWKHPVVGKEDQAQAESENRDVYFLRDGRYVRAPASDQVRIPKGAQVFLDVSEDNTRIDGLPDSNDGLHGRENPSFTKVYIPPHFRTRIAAFIVFIWLFAATAGVGITILPLILGRVLASACFSSPAPVNDIYALSIGLSVVGAVGYAVYYCQAAFRSLRENQNMNHQSPREAVRLLGSAVLVFARLLYLAVALVVVLPSLFALLTELYILIPAHTFLADGQEHVIHLVQDWTLGVLYVQMAIKLILWHPQSWPAAAVNGVFRQGWFKPNVSLATRALILPMMLLTCIAIIAPLFFGLALRYTLFYSVVGAQPGIYRFAYPVTLSVVLAVWSVHFALRKLAIWRIHIRDDVYLIGERLHNFSEKRARDVGVSRRIFTR